MELTAGAVAEAGLGTVVDGGGLWGATTPTKKDRDARPSPSPEPSPSPNLKESQVAALAELDELADSVADGTLKFTMKKRAFKAIVSTKADSFVVTAGTSFGDVAM